MATEKNTSTEAVLNHEQPRRPPCVLLAEDDNELRWLMAHALRRDGYSVVESRNGRELLEWLARDMMHNGQLDSVDLIVSDVRMPGYSGINVLHGLRWTGCNMPMVLVTAFGDAETHAAVERMTAAQLLDKPVDLDDLRVAAKSALRKRTQAEPSQLQLGAPASPR